MTTAGKSVNDRTTDCFRYEEVKALSESAGTWRRLQAKDCNV